MSFCELDIKASYETLNEDPVQDFYIPVLSEAISYDRIAGYFSSTSLALAARGIAGLIANGGRMRLIASPNLSNDDIEAMRCACEDPQGYIEQSLISDVEALGDSLRDDHVRALGWMLANGMLEMRIAYVLDESDEVSGALFHQKVGILRDSEGHAISFSGSVNETASGWLRNAEEFKVFCDWKAGQREFFDSDEVKFEEFWNGSRPYVKVFEPSEAFRSKIIRMGEGFDLDSIALNEYVREQKRMSALEAISLFPYQRDAVEEWGRRSRRMLFEMATGTGKTRTAIACVNIAKTENRKFVCITAAPEVTLARQWLTEYEALGVRFDSVVFADGSSGGKAVWVPGIRKALSRIEIGMAENLLVLVTHASSCSDSFTDLFRDLSENVKVCFVGDEVHGLGAAQRRKALLDRYDYRIGLSATPTRWFDEDGTQLLVEYFGDASFSFGIRDAQLTVNPLTGHPFLTPYNYQLQFVSLDDDEMEEYRSLSERISKLSFCEESDVDSQEGLKRLLMRRANITKNAKGKIPLFESLIKGLAVENTLVFVSPEQIDEALMVLARNMVCAHPFTEKQGARKLKKYGGLSERELLIKEFKNGNYQALVAISCLDEGIDIPSAERAILLSSSTNPREYIQRIGRVIRYCEGKEVAHIVDFVVEPDWSRIDDPDALAFEKKAFKKELRRVSEMADNALNGLETLLAVSKRLERLYGAE